VVTALGCGNEQEGDEGGGNDAGQGGVAGATSAGSGGTGASGSGQGGASTGGTNTGGASTGGGNSGGASTGGASTGGTGQGGSAGATTGGSAGASATGGASTGGAGGMPAGGAGAGGTPLGGAGSGGSAGCMTPPPASPLVGWATQGSGTTGGGTATPTVVTSASQFMSAIGGDSARVIHVNGNISGSFSIDSNKTIIGVCGASITGDIHLNGSENVIMRNLKVVGRNCSDSPSDCSDGEDAISVNGGAHHLWFDHLDVSDGSDGNLDMTQGSDFITISWSKFSYSSRRTDPMAGASGHRFSNLIGASDTDSSDVGHLNITFHHNWWADNVDQRMPRSRRGQIHVFNNLFTSSGNSYCTNAGQDARLLVENNVYIGVNNPLEVANNGNMRSVGNVFTMVTGTQSATGTGFTPTYTYTADATSGLEAAIRAGVGPK
jgi:pectate lyase